MLTARGPKVVEFNARFGDPEAMNTLSVLETDFSNVLTAARDGESLPELGFAARATVCKYAVPEGYPDEPNAGAEVTVDDTVLGGVNDRFAEEDGSSAVTDGGRPPEALLFYASVDERDDGIYTTTSRAFAVVGIADTIELAEEVVDETFSYAGTEGLRVRHDIGTTELVESRVAHMSELRGE